MRYTLLAALCWTRQAELVDGLVELLIGLIHRINARAERRVEKELIGELANVPGKRGIFTRMVDAALEHPDDTVRDAVYPVVPGGVKTLSALARELKATERAVAERVRYQLRGSYSHYYRRMLAPLLAALEFRCNNSAYRPVTDAIDLLARYAGTDSDQKLYAAGEKVPVDGVVPKAWLDGVVDDDGRVERIPYELCVLIALRDALRRREVYVQGAGRWKDPDEDLPGDFEDNRDVHYAELGKPLDAAEFIGGLKKRLGEALTRLDTALARGTSGGVRIVTRQGSPWVSVPKLDKLPEPKNLGALKAEVERRWGTIDLLDILKDTAFITDFTDSFTSVASREVLDRATLNRRLLLVLFALGTNMGIRQMAVTGEHGVGEAELRHVRATYVTRENLRAAVTTVVNATLEARDPAWWGEATSTASDSKRFASWDSNLMTEFHARYGGYGVMIYWHVERGRLCVYSQLKSCSSSEVAAMIEGLLRHGTDAEIEANYTDTHGASLVGFAFTELLGFKLLPRLKNIGAIQLYAPDAAQAAVAQAREDPQEAAHRLGPDRPQLRPDGQVRHRAAAADRRDRPGAAPLHEGRRPQAARLPRPGGTRPGRADHLRLRLPRRPAAPPRDPHRPAGRGELELRQRQDLLRPRGRPHRRRPRARRGLHARAPPPPVVPGVHQHPAPPGGPARPGLGRQAHRGGPAGPVPAVLVARQPLRAVPPRHGHPPRPHCRLMPGAP